MTIVLEPVMRLLLSYADTVLGGSPGLAIIEGVTGRARAEAGALGDRLAADGWLRVAGAARAGERAVPYAPVLDALGGAGPAAALAAAVSSGRPTLLAFDDLQHFDGWSLRLLADLLPELDRFPVLAVFTVDPVAEPAEGVADFLRMLHREAAITVAA